MKQIGMKKVRPMKKQKCEEDYQNINVNIAEETVMDLFFLKQQELVYAIDKKIPSTLPRVIGGEKFFSVKEDFRSEQLRWMEKMIACMNNELEEVREWFPWKTWKHYDNFEYNDAEVKYELIDIFHFLIEACLIMGMDGKEFMQIYKSKHKTNHKRQENNYGKEESND